MPSKTREYVEPKPITQEEVLNVMKNGSHEAIEEVLVSVAFEETDYEFALSIVLRGASSNVAAIRGTGILCLGHLARLHGRLPLDPVMAIVKKGLKDDSDYVRGQSENAADDIAIYIPELGRTMFRKTRN